MIKKFALSLLASALAALALPAYAAPPPSDPCAGTVLGCGDDLGWALDLESRIVENMRYGQVYDIDKDPATGATTSVNHFGDSALWTGTYLAAESYRYALATSHLRGPLAKDQRDFWNKQRAEAKSRIEEMAAKYHMLINISKNWKNSDDPEISPPKVYLGGAVYQGGEPGYLMRACNPTDAKPSETWTDIGRNRRVYGPLDWDDGKQYYCEDGTSRDAYAGATFGLLTAFDFVDDQQLRKQIRDDFVTLADFLVRHNWTTPRPNGRVSLPVPSSNHDSADCQRVNQFADICGHDFENFTSPLMNVQPIHRLNIAAGAWHVVHAAPGRGDVAHWDEVWADELRTQLPAYGLEMEVDNFQPNSSYYKFNLNHLTSFDVTRLATDPDVHAKLMEGFGVMDATTGDDINAHFETLTYATTGERPRFDAAVTHLRQWRDYYTRIHTVPSTKNSCAPDACVADDQMEIDQPGLPPVIIPGTSSKKRAKNPIPVASRPPGDFLWQKPPWQLEGSEGINHYYPGIDYLLPYWMLRYYDEVAPPKLESFPRWDGPRHQ